MAYKITVLPEFEAQAKKLGKKYRSLPDDLSALFEQLGDYPSSGTPLGGGLYKVRLKISSKRQGKSGGGRVITAVLVSEDMVYLVALYDKSELSSISTADLKNRLRKYLDG